MSARCRGRLCARCLRADMEAVAVAVRAWPFTGVHCKIRTLSVVICVCTVVCTCVLCVLLAALHVCRVRIVLCLARTANAWGLCWDPAYSESTRVEGDKGARETLT